MKNVLFSALLCSTVIFSSCGGGSKKLKPSNTKISGPLSSYFEVVDREYKIKDGTINVEFKRIADGMPAPWVPEMRVGYSSGYIEPGFTIEILDSDGDVVSKDETSIVLERDELEVIVGLGVGESSSVPFNVNDSDNPVSFKIGSTCIVHEPDNSTSSNQSSSSSDNDYPSQICVTGTNVRLRKGPSLESEIYKNLSGDPIYPEKGEFLDCIGETADWYMVKYDGDVFYISKQFSTNAESSLSSVANDLESSLNSIADAIVESGNTYSSSGSEDWDSLLDSYDSYVTKYINIMKKVSNGDITAMTEYPALLEKAQEFSNKMSGAQGDMSASQWARYMKISNKMLNAAQMQ